MKVLFLILFPLWLTAQNAEHTLIFAPKDSFYLSGTDTIINISALVNPGIVNWSTGKYCMCLYSKDYMVCDPLPTAIVNFTITPPEKNYWVYRNGYFQKR